MPSQLVENETVRMHELSHKKLSVYVYWGKVTGTPRFGISVSQVVITRSIRESMQFCYNQIKLPLLM